MFGQSITGRVSPSNVGINGEQPSQSGALYAVGTGKCVVSGSTQQYYTNYSDLFFDASKGDSRYSGATFQPRACLTLLCIKF